MQSSSVCWAPYPNGTLQGVLLIHHAVYSPFRIECSYLHWELTPLV